MTPADLQARLDRLQGLQGEVSRLRDTYRDSQPAFWALAVAWEAIRFAWYVVAGDFDSARAKLTLVDEAIRDYRDFDQKKDA